ncbi:MAG: hypothetical protein HY731_10270 [Candidatus Tectomicrobia bacterium]|nr:hypothetical protein [Candidatus Tectomicrobia bacterium]
MKRYLFVLATFIGILLAWSFPSSVTPASAAGVIKMQITSDTGIGNPILNKAVPMVGYLAFDPLVEFNDQGKLVPSLAKSWDFADDNKTITFHLHSNVKWQDGKPFTAADVDFTLNTILDSKTLTPQRTNLKVGDKTVSWKVVDNETITFSLPEPYAPFMFNLSGIKIIPKHLLSASADINKDPFNLNPIGTGAYKVTEWQQGSHIVLTAFKDYFAGAPQGDKFVLQYFADQDAAAAALEKGELDLKWIAPEQQERFLKNPKFKVLKYVYYTPITLAFNHKHPVLKDRQVRQAIGYAIDKRSLMNTVTKGLGKVANYQYSDGGTLDFYNNYALSEDVYDPARARRLLEEAGWKDIDGDGILKKDGEKLSLTITTWSGFAEYENVCTIVQEMLKKVGIQTEVKLIARSGLEEMRYDVKADPKGRALEVQEWPHPFRFDPDLYRELHSSAVPPSGDNYMWYNNPQVDELLAKGRTTMDPEKRREIYLKLQEILKEDRPSIPLYIAVDAYAVAEYVGGVPDDTPNVQQFVFIYPEKLFVKKKTS